MTWSEVALSSIGDAVIVTNGEGQVTFMNPIARTMTGWNDEALGKALPEVFRIVNGLTRLAVENPFTKLMRVRIHGDWTAAPASLISKEPLKDIGEGTVDFLRGVVSSGGRLGKTLYKEFDKEFAQ